MLVVYLFLRDTSFNVCFLKVFLFQLERESKKVRKKLKKDIYVTSMMIDDKKCYDKKMEKVT